MRLFRFVLAASLLISPVAPEAQAGPWTDAAKKFVAERVTPNLQRSWTSAQQAFGSATQSAGTALAPMAKSAREKWAEFFKYARLDRYQRFQRYLPSCRQTLAAVGTAAVLSAGGIGYYNIPYSTGAFKNVGTEDAPSLMPDITSSFVVQERSPTFSIPPENALQVHDGSHGFGKVTYRNERIEYWNGDQLIASSDVFVPSSRPYSRDFPIVTQLYDSWNNSLGSIEEINEETSPGEYQVIFVVKNATGKIVGETSDFVESAAGERSGRWQLDLRSPGSDAATTSIGRRGWIWNRYLLASQKDSPDVRALIMLAGYKYAVDKARAE